MNCYERTDHGVLLLVVLTLVPAVFLCTLWPACVFGAEKTVLELWSEVSVPSVPKLQTIKADPKTTALLILDIEERTTNIKRRPRAVASVPAIEKLLARARGKGMPVVFSTTPKASPKEILSQVAPRKDEPVVKSSVDKFFMTNLDEILRTKGIDSVIIVGTAAEGAVLHTATAAAMRSLNVIVPVDGISSSELYAEQYVCWHLLNAPGSRNRTTLTRTDMIEISP